jgi:hypothetical protein
VRYFFFYLGGFGLAVGGCQQAAPNVETVAAVPTTPAPPAIPPITTSAPFQAYWLAPTATDTVLILQGRAYHLRLQAAMDSTKRLLVSDKITPKPADKAKGYDATFTITLTDSVKRQVFQRRFHKADFFHRVSEEVVVPSGAVAPTLLGYSAPLGGLVFTLGFAVPDTDWGADVLVLLDLKGQVLRMSEGNDYGGGPDCTPTFSADRRALLTTSEILRARQHPVPLARPDAELRGAFLLNDSCVVTLYQLGKRQTVRTAQGNWDEHFSVSKAQRTAPNAFVRHIHTGQLLSQFRYEGYYEELGYIVPSAYLPALQTWYLLDDRKGLYRVPSRMPSTPTVVPFTAMTKFAQPQRGTEVRFEQQGAVKHYAFYVDTLAPNAIRYQVLFGG